MGDARDDKSFMRRLCQGSKVRDCSHGSVVSYSSGVFILAFATDLSGFMIPVLIPHLAGNCRFDCAEGTTSCRSHHNHYDFYGPNRYIQSCMVTSLDRSPPQESTYP